jgi:hypothetical protein
MEVWKQLLLNALTSAAAVGIMGYFIRSLVKAHLDKNLERFKDDLITASTYLNQSLINLSEERFKYLLDVYAEVSTHIGIMRKMIYPHFPAETKVERNGKF